MLNIGICDDDRQFTNQLENIILKYLENNHFKADIQIFTKSQDLIQYIQNEEDLDLLFLDIELDDITGIAIGKSLRSEFHNDSVQIVFISSKEHYAIQLFNVRPLNFLVKPIDYKKVEYIMDEYNRLFKFQYNYFEYHVGKQTYQINEQSILYFQSVGKKIHMVTCGGNKDFYGKLSDVYKRLNAQSFCETHKSYIINMRYVSEYAKEQIVMTNGDIVPVSRSMRSALHDKIIENEWGNNKNEHC